ncbi:hypothetical protein CNYM01_10592 [Colletotrichum nymphaeae SA-01]|uniref:Uncharacterized protein n=1 Tax=Colletotrichum nymphaeae SA-01 TaxID=1460502 RepID=A0A135TUD8_9PEZI|nr:hypothetical protein CNYM01_10592 [Colletotrichum nymphaeae SA-01]
MDKNSLLALVSLILSPKLDNLQAALRGQGAAQQAAGRGSAISAAYSRTSVTITTFATTDTTDITARPFFVLFCAVILIFLGAQTRLHITLHLHHWRRLFCRGQRTRSASPHTNLQLQLYLGCTQ